MASQPTRKLNENKPGEPTFQMKIEPDAVLSFRAPPGGFILAATSGDQKNAINLEIKLTNTTKNRQTYKVSILHLLFYILFGDSEAY